MESSLEMVVFYASWVCGGFEGKVAGMLDGVLFSNLWYLSSKRFPKTYIKSTLPIQPDCIIKSQTRVVLLVKQDPQSGSDVGFETTPFHVIDARIDGRKTAKGCKTQPPPSGTPIFALKQGHVIASVSTEIVSSGKSISSH